MKYEDSGVAGVVTMDIKKKNKNSCQIWEFKFQCPNFG